MTLKILVHKSSRLSFQKRTNSLCFQNGLKNKFSCLKNMGERILNNVDADGLFLNISNVVENEMERGDTIQNDIERELPMVNRLKLFYNRTKEKLQIFAIKLLGFLTEFICFSLILLHYTLGNQYFWNICNAFSSAFMEVFVYITLAVSYVIIVCLINLTDAYETYTMFRAEEDFKDRGEQLIVSHFYSGQSDMFNLALAH